MQEAIIDNNPNFKRWFKDILVEIIKEDRFDGDKYFSSEAVSHAARSTIGNESTNILIRMSPDDFLSMAQEIAPQYKEYSDSEAKKLQELMKSGVKMNGILFLAFVHDGQGTAYVTGHEGRHRANALKNMKVQGVPVLLISQKDKGQLIKWNQQEDPSESGYFKQVWPTKLKGEDGRGTEIDFPVTWEAVTA